MALPDHLADLERKVSARLNEALEELRHEVRRTVESAAQRASSAMLSELDAIGPLDVEKLLAGEELLEMARQAGGEGRRDLARSLHLALVEFDRARTQNAVLAALLAGARPFGDHAALWLMRPHEILGWASVGYAGDPVAGIVIPHAASPALKSLAEGRAGVLLTATDAAHLASVLEIEAPKGALFVPLVLRDRVAAALYLDSTSAAEFEIEALQMLVLAAAQRLELQALSTRSYTPTLFLDGDAPESERGLALWDPESLAAESAAPDTSHAAAMEVAEEDLPDADAQGPETLAESMPTVSARFDFSAPASRPDLAEAEIAWQMEETEETDFMGSVPRRDLMAELAPIPSPTPTAPIPEIAQIASSASSAPFAPFAPSEGREADETTDPHPTISLAETQRFEIPQAVTNEFPRPFLEDSPVLASVPSSNASTIVFAPPVDAPEADFADDPTVMLSRSEIQPTPQAQPSLPTLPSPVVAEPEAPEEQTHPAISVPDDEPTIVRGPRTNEVTAPPDLKGPGWAFTSARSPRGSGENALHEEARRLARLLVSEIKLYNEDQVEEGRHNRDIYHRLKDDIDRSRQIYEERVHESVRGTTDYFQQELIRSLAGGDPRALGI